MSLNSVVLASDRTINTQKWITRSQPTLMLNTTHISVLNPISQQFAKKFYFTIIKMALDNYPVVISNNSQERINRFERSPSNLTQQTNQSVAISTFWNLTVSSLNKNDNTIQGGMLWKDNCGHRRKSRRQRHQICHYDAWKKTPAHYYIKRQHQRKRRRPLKLASFPDNGLISFRYGKLVGFQDSRSLRCPFRGIKHGYIAKPGVRCICKTHAVKPSPLVKDISTDIKRNMRLREQMHTGSSYVSFGLSPYSSEDEDGDRGDDWEDISNNNCSGDKLIACYEKALSGL